MPPRSPTMAFEPSPALESDNKENFSPFRERHHSGPMQEAQKREVRFSSFSPVIAPARRAQSITNTVPLLEPIASASRIPSHSQRSKNAPEFDMDAFFEHHRALLESQRGVFEREKKAFGDERKLWEQERSYLQSRIADLEFKLNKSGGGASKRRFSSESPMAPLHTFRADFGSFSSISNTSASRTSSQSHTTPPVWEGPETSTPVTRVFSSEDTAKKTASHLPSISEDEMSPLHSREMSPLAKSESIPVPIDQLDSTLDGITLKSTALIPSFVARVMTPQSASPAHSPSPRPRALPGHVPLEMDTMLSPLDEKLKRHAGHTPMAFGTNHATITPSVESEEALTPRPDKSAELAPAPAARSPMRPSERSDSYFSSAAVPVKPGEVETSNGDLVKSPDEDPELTGPLMLDPANTSPDSNVFLDRLDEKLEQVSRKATETDAVAKLREEERLHTPPPKGEKDEEMPMLRMKKSMNFGSAFGTSKPGFMRGGDVGDFLTSK